jgi:phage baseplate assembly protein W
MTVGMSRSGGTSLSGDDHLAQSIGDILSTPIGTRVMRRDYGSMIFELIDQPMNAVTRLLVFAATAIALAKWEPRIKLQRVQLGQGGGPGAFIILLSGYRTDQADINELVQLSIPIRGNADRPILLA